MWKNTFRVGGVVKSRKSIASRIEIKGEKMKRSVKVWSIVVIALALAQLACRFGAGSPNAQSPAATEAPSNGGAAPS